MRTCVIYNPSAGRGKARRLMESVRRAFPGDTVLSPTAGPGDAIHLATEAGRSGYDRVAAAGGDGTVHEVARGLLASGNADVLFSTIPVGSMNDYAHTLGMLTWCQRGMTESLDSIRADVGIVRAPGRERFFVNGCGVGFNGLVTVEAGKIRSLRGLPLYGLAFLRAMVLHFAKPTMTIRTDGTETTRPTLAFSANLGQREGGFPITRRAKLDDGDFETLHAADVRRWELLRYLPAMISGNLPVDHPQLGLGRSRRIGISSEANLCIHTDGEFFALPADGVRELEIELLPQRLRVEVCPAFQYGCTAKGER